LVVYGLDPLLERSYEVQKTLLPGVLGVAAPYVTATLAAAAVIGLLVIRSPKRRCA
jgi:hypothetical protein